MVSVYQAVILFLFDSKSKYTVNEIKETLNLSYEDLKASLMGLCNPKKRLLIYNNKKPEFKPDEEIEINMAFNHNNKRIPYAPTQTPQQIASQGIDGKSLQDIEEDVIKQQQFVIEATIVRVMKARKASHHNELMQEVISQIKMFKAQPKMIKQSTEKLIERDYLKRDEEDRTKYVYLP